MTADQEEEIDKLTASGQMPQEQAAATSLESKPGAIRMRTP
jgi:uncharacterized protein YidB (DUF937 family)